MISRRPQIRNEKRLSGFVLNMFLKRKPFYRATICRWSSVASEPSMNIDKEISLHIGKKISSQYYKISFFCEIN